MADFFRRNGKLKSTGRAVLVSLFLAGSFWVFESEWNARPVQLLPDKHVLGEQTSSDPATGAAGGPNVSVSSSGEAPSDLQHQSEALSFSSGIAQPFDHLNFKTIFTRPVRYQSGDLIVTGNNILRIKSGSVDSEDIGRSSLRNRNFGSGSVNSRVIDNGTIVGEDINPQADIAVRSLSLAGGLTVDGIIHGSIAGSFAPTGDVDMAGHTLNNIGSGGAAFDASGNLILGVNTLTTSNTGLVANLNADMLDGQHGSFYQNASNINAGALSASYGGTGSAYFTVSGPSATRTYTFPDTNGTVPLIGSTQTWTANQTFADATSTDDTLGFAITSGGAARFAGTLTNADLTAAHSWILPNVDGTIITTGNLSSITSVGTIVSGTWNGTAIDLAHGGTNANLTASNGGIVYSTGSALALLSGTPTAGQILLSGASANPTWSTATYPATAGTSGNLLQSNGTNWVSWTPTYISGNQSITLSGDVTGSGTTSIATSYSNAVPVDKGGTGSAYFTVSGPSATRTYTFPDTSSTVCTTSGVCTGYQAALTNPVTGTGAANQIAYWNATNTLTGVTAGANSFLTTNGSNVPALTALSADTFTQYALLAGRSGGQTLIGGTAANNTLTIQGTSASGNTATNANLAFKVGDAGATTAMTILNNGNVGIGTTSPGVTLPSVFYTTSPRVLEISNTGSNDSGLFLRRSDNVVGLDIWERSSNGNVYLDHRHDSASTGFIFRNRTNGTPVTSLTLTSSGATFGVPINLGTNHLNFNNGTSFDLFSLESGFSALALQTPTTNTASRFYIIPKGSPGAGAQAALKMFNSDYVSDSTNYSDFGLWAGSDYNYINSKQAGTAKDIVFAYNDTNYLMTIKTNGNVGIGTTPSYALDVKASGTGVIARFNSSNATGCTLADGGTISCSSDIRLKKNIDGINYGLSALMQLKPVAFNWKTQDDSAAKTLGFIAQDVEQVIPQLVTTDAASGYKELNTIGLIPVLAKSIQEQQSEISNFQFSISNQFSDSNDQISQLSLKTDASVTTLSQLQTSIDEQFTKITNYQLSNTNQVTVQTPLMRSAVLRA